MSKSIKSFLPLICILLVPVTSGSVMAQGQNDFAERIFDRAVQLHQSGDMEGAIREYQSFLALRPDNVEARSNLGAALARLGHYQEAIEQYQKALAADGQNLSIRFNLGVAFYKASQIPQAVAELNKVVAARSENLNAIFLLADCYLRLGEYKKVVQLLSPLEATRPDDRTVAYLLGTALIRDHQVERGQKVIDRILRDGESSEARLLLGTAQLMARDYAGALKDLSRAIELNPKLPTAHAYYGRALLDSGNPDEAQEAFRKELELNPHDFESNLYLGVLLRQEQKNDEALSYFKRALLVRPGALDVRYQIGSLLLSAGKLTEAQSILEQVIADAPDFVQAHVSLATVYYRLKRQEDGDRHRAIVQKLNAEAQSRALGAPEHLGPSYHGEGSAIRPTTPKSQTAPPE